MVTSQLVSRGISDRRVLEAMARVPREAFVPPAEAAHAYEDRALPIGEGQTISQPYMVATMTQALGLSGSERVLEIGTGSGYQTAVLAELARDVISIERRPALAAAAVDRLRGLGYADVQVIVGDGSLGHEAGAAYDAILVTAGAPRVPEPLKRQLADGGRLVVPVGPPDGQTVHIVLRQADRFVEVAREGCVFVPLVGAEAWPE